MNELALLIRGRALLEAGLPPELVEMQETARQRQYAQTWGTQGRHLVLVDAQPVGEVWIGHRPDSVTIVDLTIAPGHQRRGLGTGVIAKVRAIAGLRPLRLSVHEDNANARHLYTKLGFSHVDGTPPYLHLELRPSDLPARKEAT